MHIPVAVGLVGQKSGSDLTTSLDDGAPQKTHVLNLRQAKQTFKFRNVGEDVVPSIGRSFSAPVKFESKLRATDQAFLMAKDSDPFNRWESGQKFATDLLVEMTAKQETKVDRTFVSSFSDLLADARKDPAFTALAITLPSEMELAQSIDLADPSAIHAAREALRKTLGHELHGKFVELYHSLKSNEPYAPDSTSAGKRALRNTCLRYITANDTPQGRSLAYEHFNAADNMTDKIAGLAALVDTESQERSKALNHFYESWKSNALVIDKWMTLQAQSCHPETLKRVMELTRHPAFNIENPNRVRSLIGAFAMGNQLIFHAADGSGYEFLADQVLQLDSINPQVAARLCGAFETWRRFDQKRQSKIKTQLTRILKTETLSRNVREISEKTLG
jgi:aminopeptidase N